MALIEVRTGSILRNVIGIDENLTEAIGRVIDRMAIGVRNPDGQGWPGAAKGKLHRVIVRIRYVLQRVHLSESGSYGVTGNADRVCRGSNRVHPGARRKQVLVRRTARAVVNAVYGKERGSFTQADEIGERLAGQKRIVDRIQWQQLVHLQFRCQVRTLAPHISDGCE